AMVVGAGLGLGVQRQDWLWLSAAIGMVWVAESLNTAFEYLCDALRPERDEMIKRAKDVAAGATLIAALTAMAIGALVFAPYLF
ncbi:MAG TPA: diacylglycerol kinase family protein, partial [Aliiroseovarius sp.]|nr:diacylglycerol kinase family protein [Aliiroseovarius sp.]